MNVSTIPETIPMRDAFVAVLSRVIEAGYSHLDDAEWNEVGKDDWDCDMSNAIEEAAYTLGLPTDAESCGVYFEWAASAGYSYPDDDSDDDTTDQES